MLTSPRILVYTSPSRGHLYPIMDTALALARRGARVHVRTLAGECGVVEGAGLEAAPLDPRIEATPMTDWQVTSPVESVSRALSVFSARAVIEVEDLRRVLDDVRPDGVLLDTNCWGAQAAAEKSGVPWATWHPYPLPYPSVDVPPFGLGLPPARGPLGRLRDRFLRPLMDRPLVPALRGLNEVRRRVGVPELARLADIHEAPPLLLLQSAVPFEYSRRDWPANVARVGPGLWSPKAEAPAWLASTKKPIVLATCSTEYQADGRIVETAMEALADDPELQLVCTTAAVDPAALRAPAGVIVERFVPHAHVLGKACAVVAHGGMGITQRAIASGVPLCIVPWGRDQLEVGRRVAECGAGVVLPRGKLRADRLRASIAEARRCADATRRVKEAFEAAGGAERSAELVLALLTSPHGHRDDVDRRAAVTHDARA
jgi:MGT family glycosyltransferase